MSEKYKPPSGPRSTRGFNDDKRGPRPPISSNNNSSRGNYKQSYGGRDSYAQGGSRYYDDRDSYRGSGSERMDYYSSSRGRPSGPPNYRNSDRDFYRSSYKRPYPSEPKGFRGPEGNRKRPDRKDNYGTPSASASSGERPGAYKSGPPEGPGPGKISLNNLPKGPRFYHSGSRGRGRGGFSRGDRMGGRPAPKPIVKLTKAQTYLIQFTKATEVYKRVQQVGEGTYGKVYKARNTITKEYVALKKLRLESEREGFPITAMREIKLLQSFDHENVVGLLEMMVEHNQIYMIFDYMDHDLTGLLTHPDLKLAESHKKFIFKQLLEGLNYLHKRRVIHRDIKGSNILLDSIGRLKIADFGLARTMSVLNDGETPDYTNRVITIWYRPPELLLGSTVYGREVDVWGVGCLLIELYTRTAAFQGFDEVGQLHKIFNLMGTPSLEDWPDIENLPWFEMLKPKINKLSLFEKEYRPVMSEHSFDLAEKLLKLSPDKRLTAEEALLHPYFTEEPREEPLTFLKDVKGEWHEFETKKRRRKERKRLQEAKLANAQLSVAQTNTEVSLQSVPDSVIAPDGPKEQQ